MTLKSSQISIRQVSIREIIRQGVFNPLDNIIYTPSSRLSALMVHIHRTDPFIIILGDLLESPNHVCKTKIQQRIGPCLFFPILRPTLYTSILMPRCTTQESMLKMRRCSAKFLPRFCQAIIPSQETKLLLGGHGYPYSVLDIGW